ncbi:MAG: adenosylcobinamide-phosphate synthase CbiB [Roseobacter sp.]
MSAVLLLCAMLLDALFGEPAWLWSRIPHPAVAMGRLLRSVELRWNKNRARKAKGCVCLSALLLLSVAIGYLIALFGPVAEILLAAVLLAQRSLAQHVRAVADGLRRDLATGRSAVAMIVSRDTSGMDESQIARAAIESAAENLSDGVIAPAFWFLVAGLPGLVAYKMVNTADSMIGYRTARYNDFGWAAARLDDVMNLIPARLTAGLISICAWQFDVKGIRADANLHRSPNAGWPEAAMSRALGIALSGPRAYDGEMRDFPWVNENARRSLSFVDIDASIAMLWKSWAAFFILCALIGLLSV